MTQSHSPGPWKQESIQYWADIIAPGSISVAMVHSDADCEGAPDMAAAVANARLIAAAPDMLAALQMHDALPAWPDSEALAKAMKATRAAIAKATKG